MRGIDIEIHLKKKKMQREDMEKIDTTKCLKKKQRLEEYQRIIARQEGLNIIMNKIVL